MKKFIQVLFLFFIALLLMGGTAEAPSLAPEPAVTYNIIHRQAVSLLREVQPIEEVKQELTIKSVQYSDFNQENVDKEETEEVILSDSPVPEGSFQAGEGLLEPSGVTEAQMKQILIKDFVDYAEVFVQAEKETGVNAIWLAAIAASESGYGTSPVAYSHKNLFGWSGGPNGEYSYFDSPEDCIMEVASLIKDLYLTEGGIYFEGYYIEDVCIHYNGRQSWIDLVTEVHGDIIWRLNNLEDTKCVENLK